MSQTRTMTDYAYTPLSSSSLRGHASASNLKDSICETRWSTIWRGINAIMAVFFLLSAYVNLNDPDPYLWVPAYVIPAGLSIAVVIQPQVIETAWWKWTCLIHLGVCLISTLYLTGVVIEMLGGKPTNPLIYEEGRELAGLVIVQAWLSVCRFTSFGSSEPTRGITGAMLVLTGILGVLPLFFWGLCFVESLGGKLGHCTGMFAKK